MSLIQQLARLRLTSGALRNQVGRQCLSTSNQRLRARNRDDSDNTCNTDRPHTTKARDERVTKRKESPKTNDSALKKKQNSSPNKSKSSHIFKPTNYQAGSGPARALHSAGDITKSFDNIKASDTEGGIVSGRRQAPPEGHLAGSGSSVLDAVKLTGHNIMDKMSKASEKTIEAGHNLADQAKNAMGMHSTRRPFDIAALEAKHEPQLNRFSIRLNDNNNEEAVLQYRKTGDHSIDYYHTEVPSNYRGNGIGSILARAAFDHAADNHLRMRLSCSYLQDYLNKNPSEKYNRIVLDR